MLTSAIKLITANIFITAESHNLMISSYGPGLLTNRLPEMLLNHDSAAGDKLEDEHDRGNDQQQMDQTATYATDQSQQPEHNE